MKPPTFENIVTDEAAGVTYVVVAPRRLNDGELFSAIRLALLTRGRNRPKRGDRLVIDTAHQALRAKVSHAPARAA
jgi:hypothetical protein